MIGSTYLNKVHRTSRSSIKPELEIHLDILVTRTFTLRTLKSNVSPTNSVYMGKEDVQVFVESRDLSRAFTTHTPPAQ